MKIYLRYFILFLILFSCNNKNDEGFSGEYNGFWADTFWKYTFYSNNTFDFECEGHYAFLETSGIYLKKGDSIFITSIDSMLLRDRVVNELYLIDNDSCIIDYKLKYDYCKNRINSKKRGLL